MAAPRRRRRRAAGFTTHPDPARVGPLLREAGFCACDEDPVAVRATFDAEGNPRGVTARYANGWTARLRLNRSGSYSLAQTYRFVSRPRGEG